MSAREPYISAAEVTASYKGVGRRHVALHNVTLEVFPGAVSALVGPNGAGKTTLFRVLLGFLRPDSGCCRVGGLEPVEFRRRHGVAYVPEFPAFPRGWACRDILGRSVDLVVCPDGRADAFALAMERAGLDHRTLSRTARKCSNGTQRRLSIACALIGAPEVVLLDEPFAGLDPPARAALRQEIQRAREGGAVVLVATHDLAEVARLADRIVAMSGGGITDTRTVTANGKLAVADLETELFGEQ